MNGLKNYLKIKIKRALNSVHYFGFIGLATYITYKMQESHDTILKANKKDQTIKQAMAEKEQKILDKIISGQNV